MTRRDMAIDAIGNAMKFIANVKDCKRHSDILDLGWAADELRNATAIVEGLRRGTENACSEDKEGEP